MKLYNQSQLKQVTGRSHDFIRLHRPGLKASGCIIEIGGRIFYNELAVEYIARLPETRGRKRSKDNDR